MDRVVVVGASLAGVHATEALRRSGYQGRLALVGAESAAPYDRPPLTKRALRDGASAADLALKETTWYDDQEVDLILGTPAADVRLDTRELVLADGRLLPYDGLVISSGSTARPLPGLGDFGPVHSIRSIDDSIALHDELSAGRHVLVIGAGFIGLEIAATARAMGLDVTVLEAASAPLARVLGPETGRWFTELHARNGVEVRCGVTVDHVQPAGTARKVTLSDGTMLMTDVVVAGVGAAPATSWLERSGLETSDGVVCDPSLRTSAPGVVAAGDVARWHHPLLGHGLRVEQWFNAVEQGQHAAATLLGADDPFQRLPYFWSDQYNAKIHCVGIATGADVTEVQRHDERSMAVAFGRDGFIRGALCVNAPRDLMRYRQAIADRVPWSDISNN